MKIPTFVFALLLTALGDSLQAEVKVAAIFSDHIVLQREAPVNVWGTAGPGESVAVAFAGQSKQVAADKDGKWMVKLDPMPASSEPRELRVASITIKDVLVGEVWLASGQSNMGFGLSGAHNAATEIPKAEDPQLRFFKVKMQTAGEPQSTLAGEWEACSPKAAPGFSAVAYFFARELRAKLGCPVGIIQSAWGGTPGQAWLSIDAMRAEPALARHVKTWDEAVAKRRALDDNPQTMAAYEEQIARWKKEVRPSFDAATKAYNAAKAAGQNPGPKPEPSSPEPANPDPMGVPSPSSRPSTPSVIFNAMIAPLAPYTLRGAIWYQGEANGSAGLEYRALLPALIADWRKHWGAEIPFLIVQLPGWEHDTKPAEMHDWPWLREAQLMTLKVPRTGLAVTIDIGDPGTVHPGDKLDVGLRLALAARKVAYGENIVGSGPLYRDYTIEGAAIRVKFTETGGGLAIGVPPWVPKDASPLPTGKLTGFTIAGEDHHWEEADAKIEGDSVLVSSPQVPKPIAVRYAWANSPRCNLYNKEGLPASPFRTDDWPLPSKPSPSAGAETKPPNIIIFMTDDQGYADVGVFGAKGFTTPNLDRMAHEGRRFTDFHAAQPVCSASRAGLLTGCYPNRIGIHGALGPNSKTGISDDEMTLAQLVKQRGYATAIYGKWHLGDRPQFLPTRHGFDEYFGIPYSNDMWPNHPEARPGAYPPLPLYDGETPTRVGLTHADQEQLTTWYAEHAVSFIERHKDQPFFLYVVPNMPHVPLHVSDKFRGKSARGLYGDVIEEIDWAMGEILGALKKNGLDENTLVLFTSDNGPWLSYGNHAGSAEPLREGKGTNFDGGHREPFIARWPGKIPADTVCPDVAMSIDIFPTVARLLGAELPKHKIDGLDIWPLFTGEPGAKNPHDAYFFYYDVNALQAVRSGDWKLFFPHTSRTMQGQAPGKDGLPGKYKPLPVGHELYNLSDDIGETKDVAAANPEVVKRLEALAEQAREDMGDALTHRIGSGAREPGRWTPPPQ